MEERERETIKRELGEIGIDVSDDAIERASRTLQDEQRYQAKVLELRTHLALQHYTMGGLELFGLESLEEIHKSAREQGNHEAQA